MVGSVAPRLEKCLMAALPNLVMNKPEFDPRKFLATIGTGRKVVTFPQKQTIFTQGEAADAVFYIQKGKVRLTVVSKVGKEATLAILSEGEFFGEGGLAGQPFRMGSATAMTDCEVLRIDKKAMMLALMGFDLRAALKKIEVPTLLLSGSKDNNAPAPMMKKMASYVPHAKYAELEGVGHLANLERPMLFNASLASFLTACFPPEPKNDSRE